MGEFELTCCSTVDLSPEWLKKKNIHYALFNYILDDINYKDDMWQTMTPDAFFAKVEAGANSSTSMVSIGEYMDFFRPFLENGRDVLHVCLSSGITSSVESARQAATILREDFPERKLFIVDSLCASAGYGLLVDKMAELRDMGFSIEDVRDWAEENRREVIHWFFVHDLKYLIKGGRVSKAAGAVGQMLNICPLMNVDNEGRLAPQEKIRTKKKVIRRTVEKMKEDAKGGVKYDNTCFISCTDPVAGEELKRQVEEEFPNMKGKVKLFRIGATIATHTGPGTVALFFWGDKRV